MKLQAESNITCLVCKDQSEVPAGGVKKLPEHFFFHRITQEAIIKQKIQENEDVKCNMCSGGDIATALCIDCSSRLMCAGCHGYHKIGLHYQGHRVLLLNEIQTKEKDVELPQITETTLQLVKCKYHEKELNFYCETCNQLVCYQCCTDKHRKHRHDTIKKIASKERTELNKISSIIENMVSQLVEACEDILTTRERVGSRASELNGQIDQYFNNFQTHLQQQRNRLKEELSEVCAQKKRILSLQLEQMEYTQAQLESVKELSEAVKSGSDQEALFMKKQLAEDVKRLTSDYKKLDTEPVELANMEFVKSQKSFPSFGSMFYGSRSPFNIALIYNGSSPYLQLNNKVDLTLGIKDLGCLPQTTGHKNLSIQVQQKKGDAITIPAYYNNKLHKYRFSITPKQIGQVKLSVDIDGQLLQFPSTFQVHDYSALSYPNRVFNDQGRMGLPMGVAFSKSGVWAMTDSSNHCVCVFSTQDELIKKFGSYGNGNSQLNHPYGLAFDTNNYLYVVDTDNHRVQKFDISGSYVLQFGTKGSKDGQLSSPVGITVHNNRVFVADKANNRISVFQCSGQFSYTLGSSNLSSPQDIIVTSNKQVLVTNYYSRGISIFTLDGKHLRNIYHYRGSHGITTNLCGYIFVTETGDNYVSIFDIDGNSLHRFRSYNHGLLNPTGIACSPNGKIYICDSSNKRIQIFSDYLSQQCLQRL